VAKLDDIHTIKASPVDKVVDTTGAGDQYAAGVLFGLTQGLHVTACAELGSLAASEVISHYGPRAQVSLKALAVEKGLI
ncbi:MAG TPA: PfkB family carbohydrate kinase, partial [Asticcacaulis sp.]|nr:PfkB family carbohydrate kinase [Asticcacaulis sp.]